jgi:hypothetical protein
MSQRRVISFLAVISLVGLTAWAGVPQLINFQGQLKNNSGSPLINDTLAVEFKIYDAVSAGNVKWSEIDTVITDANGLFTILLGKKNPVPDSAFNDSLRWLGIKVGSDAEISPRSQIGTAGYVYRVNSVDGASGGTITSKVSIGLGHTNTGIDAFVTGNTNTVSGDYSTVSGGRGNTASGDSSTIGGGTRNMANNLAATVSGGIGNTAGFLASVAGGFLNVASAAHSTVGGGREDTANGFASAVPGGWGNKALGDFSFAAGLRAKALHHGSFVWGDNTAVDFASTSNNQFLIRAAGGVGIGTNSPANQLDVEGAVAIGAAYSGIATAPTNGLIVQGNVGIGTPTPASKLHVQNGNTATSFVGTLGSVSEAASNSSETKYGSYGVGSGTQGSKIGVAGLAKGSGTMGVGVSGEAFVASAVNWGLFGQAAGSGSENYGVYATATGGTTNWAGYFAGNVHMSGQVGIGTPSPSARLHVKGANFPNSFGFFDTDASSQDAGLRFQEAGVVKSHLYHQASTNTLNLYGEGFSGISVTSIGRVGIGTTATVALLHVNGTAGNNTGVWSNLSDLRLKKDIEPIEGALEGVKQLKGVTFRWKDTKKDAEFGRVRGLIAQDVEKVIPEWIKTDPDGYKRLEPIGIDALLIEAIKDQQKQIEELKAEIAKLKNQPSQAQVEINPKGGPR